jgi:hypothetical protein
MTCPTSSDFGSAWLRQIEDAVNAGKLDVLEGYRPAAPDLSAEQEAAERPGSPPAVSR